MKNGCGLSSLSCLLLLLFYLGYACGINVYQNNEYEVSDIDKRISIPHPGHISHHHHHHHGHGHHGLKRHHIITVTPDEETSGKDEGQLLIRRQEVPVPDQSYVVHQQRDRNHGQFVRQFDDPYDASKKDEVSLVLPDEISNEIIYKKSIIAKEDTDKHEIGEKDRERASHEIGFA